VLLAVVRTLLTHKFSEERHAHELQSAGILAMRAASYAIGLWVESNFKAGVGYYSVAQKKETTSKTGPFAA